VTATLASSRAHVVRLNRDYVRHGEVVPEELFVIEDVNRKSEYLLVELNDEIEEIRGMLASPEAPQINLSEDDIDPRHYPLLFPGIDQLKAMVSNVYDSVNTLLKQSSDIYDAMTDRLAFQSTGYDSTYYAELEDDLE
jgi:hypothetical protein